MISLKLYVFLTVFLYLSESRKSDDKCNEYINLLSKSSSRIDVSSRSGSGSGKIAAASGEFPHMAALVYGEDVLCGGSLISDQFILTSARCVSPSRQNRNLTAIRLGSIIVNSKDSQNIQEFTVSEVFIHPNYKLPSHYNDIALAKLNKPIRFTSTVSPACLQAEKNLNTDHVIATGWGVLDFGGERSENLMKVSMDVFTNEECNETYKNTSKRNLKNGIVDEMLCSGGRTEPKSTCQGDSGGPLQILRSNSASIYNIVGIISFGKGCGIVNVPEVATRVSSYVPWIESIVWP